MKKGYTLITNDATSAKTLELFIYGPIDDWYQNNKVNVLYTIRNEKPSSIIVHISSLGGDVDNAIAIKNILSGINAPVTAYLYGFVASSATIVSLGADTVEMVDDGLYLPHESSMGIYGKKAELQKGIDLLDKVNSIIADLYAQKTGNTSEEMLAMMAKEEWLTAEEALALGLVDKVVDKISIAASVEAPVFNREDFIQNKYKVPKNMSKKITITNDTHPKVLNVLGLTEMHLDDEDGSFFNSEQIKKMEDALSREERLSTLVGAILDINAKMEASIQNLEETSTKGIELLKKANETIEALKVENEALGKNTPHVHIQVPAKDFKSKDGVEDAIDFLDPEQPWNKRAQELGIPVANSKNDK